MTYPWHRWDHLLGTMTDTDLAAQIGCHPLTVQRRRHQLDIPVCRRHARHEAMTARAPRAGTTAAALLADPDLGMLSDPEVAAKHGCSRQLVSLVRGRHRVPASRRATAADLLATDPDLGRVPDGEIAEGYGLSAGHVGAARRSLGISRAPAAWAQGEVLTLLRTTGPLPPAAIARALGSRWARPHQAVQQILANLRRKGLVERRTGPGGRHPTLYAAVEASHGG